MKLSMNCILSYTLLLFATWANAQTSRDFFKELIEADRSAVEALVLYPELVLIDIFRISTCPEAVIRLSGVQSKARDSFLGITKENSREQQTLYYELTRFPGLIQDLSTMEKRSSKYVEELLAHHPEESHIIVRDLKKKDFEVVNDLAILENRTEAALSQLIANYPDTIQASIKALIKLPEVLTILSENIDQTVLVGDLYQTDQVWLKDKSRELNLQVAQKQAEELEDYKRQLEQDTTAYQEMLDAAALYAEDNNLHENAKTEPNQNDHSSHTSYNYSFWFGYPYWYTYPIWRPIPFYYHTGFYYNSAGSVVIVGLPSYHYVHWHYTYYPHHHAHLHAHYHRHYRRHPHGHHGFHAAVHANRRTGKYVSTDRKATMPDERKLNGGKMSKQSLKSADFERFKAIDKHQASWTRTKDRVSVSRSKGRK